MSAKIYIPIIFVSFVAFVASRAPARPLWLLLEDQLQPISLHDINGTIWQGNARFQLPMVPDSFVSWDVNVSHLLAGELMISFDLEGKFHQVSGDMLITTNRIRLVGIEGRIQADAVNPKFAEFGLQTTGELTVSDVNATIEKQWFSSINGGMNWSGGQVVYATSREVQTFELPPIGGNLIMDNGDLTITLTDSGGPHSLIEIVLRPDGWATMRLKGRLFRLAAVPWPGEPQDQEDVLEIEEKLW